MNEKCFVCVCAYLMSIVTVHGLAVHRERRRNKSQPVDLIHDFDVEGWLTSFGYMDNIPAGIVGDELRSIDDRDMQVRNAIKNFQYFYGLPETGRVDRATKKWMKTPRCGVPDMENIRKRKKRSFAQRFTHLGSKWKVSHLTWKLTRPTQKLRRSDQRRTISAAYKIWEDVIPMRITETTGKADIDIFFARGEHGDGAGNAFDGRSNTLAHAFGPGESDISGDAHFDNDEDWSLDSDRGSDFLVVAAHEFGHTLGLGHSRDRKALMFPAYQSQANLKLGVDDIRGVQTLYGSRIRPKTGITVEPPRRTRAPYTRAPYTRAPYTRAPFTRTPRQTATAGPVVTTTSTYKPCNLQFDAIVEGPERFFYAIKEGRVFKFKNDDLESNRPMSEVFMDAPDVVDFAFSIARKSKIYLIRDKQVWRYTNLKLDDGYPINFNRDDFPENPKFIISLIDDRGKARVIMFGSTYWWFYTFDEIQASRPLPYEIAQNWRGVPDNVKYSVRWTDNNYYLISPDSHVVFDHNRRVASSEGMVNGLPSWLDKPCAAMSVTKSATAGSSVRFQPWVVILLISTIFCKLTTP